MTRLYVVLCFVMGCAAERQLLTLDLPAMRTRNGAPITLQGIGSRRLGTFAIIGGAGKIQIDGTEHVAYTYVSHEWGEWTLYQTLAVGDSQVWLVWFYCRGTEAAYAYSESTQGDEIRQEPVSGVCMPALATSTALSAATIGVDTIDVPLAEGSVFSIVECSTERCGADWTEYHTLRRINGHDCIGIWYAYPSGSKEWAHAHCWIES